MSWVIWDVMVVKTNMQIGEKQHEGGGDINSALESEMEEGFETERKDVCG